MKCQQCGVNNASVNLAMQMNNQRMHMRLCNECLENIQNQMSDGNNFFNDGNMSNPFFQGAANGQGQTRARTQQRANKKDGLLDQLGTNVTDQARNGEIDPVIGRNEEIKRVIETLNRRNKNNQVLIGEPGVGKAAIA